MGSQNAMQRYLDGKVAIYNSLDFITEDPIVVPHQFRDRYDIEIAGFFAAMFAWGNRRSIINSATKLMELMDRAPHQFISQHQDTDLKRMLGFVHRTFNADDLLYCIEALKYIYNELGSMEHAFTGGLPYKGTDIGDALVQFRAHFFALEHMKRTEKHVSSPLKNSACKRLCMYLRWMVRKDAMGVDFGLWKTIAPHQLVMPLDVHVCKVAQRLQLLDVATANWQQALLLTQRLKAWNPKDPIIYDYALFSIGVNDAY